MDISQSDDNVKTTLKTKHKRYTLPERKKLFGREQNVPRVGNNFRVLPRLVYELNLDKRTISLYVHMIGMAGFHTTEFGEIRGDIDYWAEWISATRRQARTCFEKLIDAGLIYQVGSNKHIKRYITNYSLFQFNNGKVDLEKIAEFFNSVNNDVHENCKKCPREKHGKPSIDAVCDDEKNKNVHENSKKCPKEVPQTRLESDLNESVQSLLLRSSEENITIISLSTFWENVDQLSKTLLEEIEQPITNECLNDNGPNHARGLHYAITRLPQTIRHLENSLIRNNYRDELTIELVTEMTNRWVENVISGYNMVNDSPDNLDVWSARLLGFLIANVSKNLDDNRHSRAVIRIYKKLRDEDYRYRLADRVGLAASDIDFRSVIPEWVDSTELQEISPHDYHTHFENWFVSRYSNLVTMNVENL